MEVVRDAVGSGLHRKLILGSGVRIDKSRLVVIVFAHWQCEEQRHTVELRSGGERRKSIYRMLTDL